MGEVILTKINESLYRLQVGYTPYDSYDTLSEAEKSASQFDCRYTFIDQATGAEETRTIERHG